MRNLLHCKKFDYRHAESRRHAKKIRKGFGKIDVAYIILFFFILFSTGIEIKKHPINFSLPTASAQTYVSPIGKLQALEHPILPIPTPVQSFTTQQQYIYSLIKKTFGNYTPTAMQLLSCENSALNPNIINTAGNTPAGSQDIGVFQINDYWNNIGNVELLQDPQVNIAVAWHKFVSSGYSFNQWTCGKELGI